MQGKTQLFLLMLFITMQLSAIENIAEGKRIYQETCVSCHGNNGETNSEMELTIKPRKLTNSILSSSQMAKVTEDDARAYGAHSDIMPAFKYVYEREIESVASYVTQTFNSHRTKKYKSF